MSNDYKVLPTITRHFVSRIGERLGSGCKMSKKDIVDFVLDAIDFGLDFNGIQNRMYRQQLIGRSKKHGNDCNYRILDGYVYVFNADMTEAITIYPVPDWAVYEKNYTC